MTILVRDLSRVSTTKWLAASLFDWLVIISCIGICQFFWSWPLYILCVAVIGSRQHALAILMHDAVHFRAARGPFLNDALANWLAAFPLLITIERYRDFHLQHHADTNGPQDPERMSLLDPTRRYPFKPFWFWAYLLADLIGVTSVRVVITALYFGLLRPSRPTLRSLPLPAAILRAAQRPLFFLTAGLLVYSTGALWAVALYWIVPMATFLNAVLRLRFLAEHQGLGQAQGLDGTRNVLTGAIGAFFLAPHNVGYHLVHHRHVAVPFFHLSKLHGALLLSDPDYAKAPHSVGYLFGTRSVRSTLCC